MGASTSGSPDWGEASVRVPAPLVHRAQVVPAWVDYNGHMTEWSYLLVMGDSSDSFFRYVGIDDAYRAAGSSLFTAETHLRNLLEASEGEELTAYLQVLGVDPKRVHLAHELRSPRGVVASGEQMLLHVDLSTRRVAPMPAALHERVGRVAEAHRALPWPARTVLAIPGQAGSSPDPTR